MARPRTGSAVALWKKRGGKRVRVWYACVSYFDDNGTRKFERKKPDENTKTAARDLARKMLADYEKEGQKTFDNAHITFAELAKHYEETYLIDPEYVGGRKVAGLRNRYDFEKRLAVIKRFFRNQEIRSITYGDLARFKVVRIKTPVVMGKNTRGTAEDKPGNPTQRQRSLATVNRELSLLRRVFNVAVENGWVQKNPFECGKSLINPGDEQPRQRILSKGEEDKLLAACSGVREHLRPIVIMALDTGMRWGDIKKLRWSDVSFETGLIHIRAFNTKTMRERTVAMTQRLTLELEVLEGNSGRESDGLIFGVKTSVKKAFNKAKAQAGLVDVTFHDLRHTNASRLVAAHLSVAEVGRLLGHTQVTTTYRYVNANEETARRAVAILDEVNKEPGEVRLVN
jgi:integrase